MAATMVVVLPTFWSMLQLGAWWRVPLNAVVFAVMLALSLPRALARTDWRQVPLAVGLLGPAVAAAAGCAALLGRDDGWRAAGATLFALGVAWPVWARRFGPAWRAGGGVAALPFLAALVQPEPVGPAGAFLGWALLGAAVALAWALLARGLSPADQAAEADLAASGERTSPDRSRAKGRRQPDEAPGPTTTDQTTDEEYPPPTHGRAKGQHQPGEASGLAPTDSTANSEQTPRRTAGPRASSSQALQIGVATVVAFAVAQALDPDHLVWPVMTVLITHSGNRGRGDVLVKGAGRIVGALAGTGIAALVGGWFAVGDATAVVALFAVLALAAAARPLGHVYWAAGVTAGLALLYGYCGQSGLDLLGHRLLGILAGGAVALAAAWFLRPVRTTDVARLRLARLLAAAAKACAAAARGEPAIEPSSTAGRPGERWGWAEPARRLGAADRQLGDLEATARAARRCGLGPARDLDRLLASAHGLARAVLTRVTGPAAPDRAPLGRLAHDLADRARALADRRQPLDGRLAHDLADLAREITAQ
jgi:hypothetical protein